MSAGKKPSASKVDAQRRLREARWAEAQARKAERETKGEKGS